MTESKILIALAGTAVSILVGAGVIGAHSEAAVGPASKAADTAHN